MTEMEKLKAKLKQTADSVDDVRLVVTTHHLVCELHKALNKTEGDMIVATMKALCIMIWDVKKSKEENTKNFQMVAGFLMDTCRLNCEVLKP